MIAVQQKPSCQRQKYLKTHTSISTLVSYEPSDNLNHQLMNFVQRQVDTADHENSQNAPDNERVRGTREGLSAETNAASNSMFGVNIAQARGLVSPGSEFVRSKTLVLLLQPEFYRLRRVDFTAEEVDL